MSRRRSCPSRAWALALLLAGCGGPGPAEWAVVHEVTPPALVSARAGDPAIAADANGRVALTWVSRDSLGQDLWLALSADSGSTFSPPVRVNARAGGVSSYPESRPVAVFGPAGQLVVAWSERRGDDPQNADLAVRASGDGGRTLSPAVVVNDDARDGNRSFHGFPALAFLPDGALFAVWQDEREESRHPRSKESSSSLFYATSADGGQSWTDNRALTHRACPCCRPAAAIDSTGIVAVAYRAAGGDLRDPALAVSRDRGTRFTLDTVLSADGWRLSACPVDGPALTASHAHGGQYAWYTGTRGGDIWLAPWRAEAGIAGVRRAISDSLRGAGHPRLVSLGSTTFLSVVGRARADSSRSVVAVRALDADGALTPWLFLGANARDGWIAATDPRSVLACWVDEGADGARVRVARLTRRKGR